MLQFLPLDLLKSNLNNYDSTIDKIASAYLQDAILFLFGGCIIALSFEYSNLHTRIALKVIMLIGAKISQ